MDRSEKIKKELCRQVMALDSNQLINFTDMIDEFRPDGVENPPEVLSCRMCGKIYGECNGVEDCRKRYVLYMAG